MTWSDDLRWRAIALYYFLGMTSSLVGALLGVGASTVRIWSGKVNIGFRPLVCALSCIHYAH